MWAVRMLRNWGGLTTPLSIARWLLAGVKTIGLLTTPFGRMSRPKGGSIRSLKVSSLSLRVSGRVSGMLFSCRCDLRSNKSSGTKEHRGNGSSPGLDRWILGDLLERVQALERAGPPQNGREEPTRRL